MDVKDKINVVISGLSSSIGVVVQPIEELRFLTDEDGVVHFVSDSNLLMNAERIRNTIGEENYLNIIRSISPSKSPYRQNYSDEDMIKYMKSRYLQSPAEVKAWMDFLNVTYEQLIGQALEADEAAQVAQSAQAAQAADPVVDFKTE